MKKRDYFIVYFIIIFLVMSNLIIIMYNVYAYSPCYSIGKITQDILASDHIIKLFIFLGSLILGFSLIILYSIINTVITSTRDDIKENNKVLKTTQDNIDILSQKVSDKMYITYDCFVIINDFSDVSEKINAISSLKNLKSENIDDPMKVTIRNYYKAKKESLIPIISEQIEILLKKWNLESH